ncbi:MAG: RNA methyltransferase [Cytophagales bacterium]|nr:RNA methyltransferase [Cytophaga sp.]
MLNKQTVKFTKSLQNKKFRRLYNQFIVEGEKSVLEVMTSDFSIDKILVTQTFINKYKRELKSFSERLEIATEAELADAGSLQSNDAAIAICAIKTLDLPATFADDWIICLDTINDPGNLGTIIRIADWYGISTIVCSEDTADVYNPKVINASKGSFIRVSVYYTNLQGFLTAANRPVYAADLQGENIHTTLFPSKGILVMGNEAHGMTAEVKKLIQHTITIPRYGHAESLNVGIATAIFCDRIRSSNVTI